MESTNSKVRVLETFQVSPLESPQSASELSLPLTFFDTFWINFHPVERIFFYEISDLTSEIFHSSILPKLKNSLSVALLHFLPLSGRLIWPSEFDEPYIFYTPEKNTVSISVAESDEDFQILSGNGIREIVKSHPYIPELSVSESEASVFSFQITLFTNQGFCIGVSSHHAILDGKSVTMFLKAWAHLCKNENDPCLPSELTPMLDRNLIQDPEGIAIEYLNNWYEISSLGNPGRNPKSLNLMSFFANLPSPDRVRGTFVLSREDIKKLRQKVMNNYQNDNLHLSSFVLSYAYTAINILKARRLEENKKPVLSIHADCRSRLNPPLPANYFGNCTTAHLILIEAEAVNRENRFFIFVEKMSELIKKFETGGVLEGAKDKIKSFMKFDQNSIALVGLAGSPKFGVYGTDFGWGKPYKVEITSIDRTDVSISMAESRDESGGVEVGVVLTKDDMKLFRSLFAGGLKDL